MGDRRGYHHGNLRQALLDAALALISEKGAAGVSFAEAARRAGVSPAAPYRHFRDRDALITATALRGFDLFADRLRAAWEENGPSPLKAFEAVGREFLNFARDEPAYFTAMFESEAAASDDAELRAAGERAFRALYDACAGVAALAPADRRPPAHMMAYHFWALAHGVATLFGREGGGAPRAPITPDELLESGSAVYLRGLGLLPPDV